MTGMTLLVVQYVQWFLVVNKGPQPVFELDKSLRKENHALLGRQERFIGCRTSHRGLWDKTRGSQRNMIKSDERHSIKFYPFHQSFLYQGDSNPFKCLTRKVSGPL